MKVLALDGPHQNQHFDADDGAEVYTFEIEKRQHGRWIKEITVYGIVNTEWGARAVMKSNHREKLGDG